jgi:hypothetical protein
MPHLPLTVAAKRQQFGRAARSIGYFVTILTFADPKGNENARELRGIRQNSFA